MARYLGPVCKLCRREGTKLFLKGTKCLSDKCVLQNRKLTPPGGKSSRRSRQASDYCKQLRAKQSIKRWYGLLEKQFKLTFKRAEKRKGKTGDNLIIDLEKRLDNVVFKAKFASSRSQARQFVKHGHIKVNGKKADIPSMMIKIGDEIEISEKLKKNKFVIEWLRNLSREASPEWIDVDADNMKTVILAEPQKSDVKLPSEEQLVVELYSK